MKSKNNTQVKLTKMSLVGEDVCSKMSHAILNLGANALTPRQVSLEISHQVAEGPLAASLRRLFTEVRRDQALVDFRRIAAKVRREVASVVSKDMRHLDEKEEPQIHVLEYTYPLVVPVRHGVVFLFIRFAFFVSVGYVHMVEPVVSPRLT